MFRVLAFGVWGLRFRDRLVEARLDLCCGVLGCLFFYLTFAMGCRVGEVYR